MGEAYISATSTGVLRVTCSKKRSRETQIGSDAPVRCKAAKVELVRASGVVLPFFLCKARVRVALTYYPCGLFVMDSSMIAVSVCAAMTTNEQRHHSSFRRRTDTPVLGNTSAACASLQSSVFYFSMEGLIFSTSLQRSFFGAVLDMLFCESTSRIDTESPEGHRHVADPLPHRPYPPQSVADTPYRSWECDTTPAVPPPACASTAPSPP